MNQSIHKNVLNSILNLTHLHTQSLFDEGRNKCKLLEGVEGQDKVIHAGSPSLPSPSVRPSVRSLLFVHLSAPSSAGKADLTLSLSLSLSLSPKQAAALEVDLLFRRSRYVTSKFMAFPLSFSLSLSLSLVSPRLPRSAG